ncbi:MAG: hypothetical protein LBV42_03470 [Methanobrevibacter sp.]|jgi:hypothetical protein|nr:hypothetical protein [Methanobrevibacter sp.]
MLNFVKKYSKDYILLIIISLATSNYTNIFTLYLLDINTQIIDIGILNGNIEYIRSQGFWMIFVVGLQVLTLF